MTADERRRPALEPGAIAEVLEDAYGISSVAFGADTSGHDAVTRAWRVTTAAEAFSVKARPADARLDLAGRAARYLRDAGLTEVVAPVPALDGSLSVRAGEASIAVFPFVDGRRGMEVGLGDAQWERLGRFARDLHGITLPVDFDEQIPRESFRIREVEAFERVDRAVASSPDAAPEARHVVETWRRHRDVIAEVVERTAALGAEAEALGRPHVICHADLHTGNVLVGAAGELWVIDWDEVVAAPRERDLMFVIGGISRELVSDDATASFLRGYGGTIIDPVVLSYYRHAWATQDVVGYAEQVLLEPSRSEEDRAEAARILETLFRPGEIVDIARSSITSPGAGSPRPRRRT